jgi:hypothetical protein
VSGRVTRCYPSKRCTLVCHPAFVSSPSESRRYDFPPLWAVLVLLIGAVMVAVYAAAITFGLLGFMVALVFVWWIERKADAHVRARDAAND